MAFIELLIDGLTTIIDSNDIDGMQPDGPSLTILHFKNGDRLQVTHPAKELEDKIRKLSNGETE